MPYISSKASLNFGQSSSISKLWGCQPRMLCRVGAGSPVHWIVCAGSTKPLLLDNVVSIKISCSGPYAINCSEKMTISSLNPILLTV